MGHVLIHLHPDFSEELDSILQKWNSSQHVLTFYGVRPRREHEVKLLTRGAISLDETHKIAAKIRNESGYSPDVEMMIFTEKRIYTDEYYQLFFGGTDSSEDIPSTTTISLDFTRKLFNQSSGANPVMFRSILVNILCSLSQQEGFSTHDETRGCILDFCNNMSDITKSVENGLKFCDQHLNQIIKNNKNYLIDLVKVISNTNDIIKQDITITKRIHSLDKSRLQDGESEFDYDVALSFAGEDRKYAKELANVLVDKNIEVFYDGFEKAALWGEDLFVYLSDLYRLRAKYCVMFLSKNYAVKLWTNHEREAAQSRAFKENKAYILPICLDDTEIPGILETTMYLNWHEEGSDKIALYLLKKLGRYTGGPTII